MRRFLCYSHEDYVAKMVAIFDANINTSPEEIESFIGIEFAMKDKAGATAFISDVSKFAEENPNDNTAWDRFAYWEDQDVDTGVFRINSPEELPAKYPVLVLVWIDDDYDRSGAVTARIVEFVYESEFNPKAGV